MSEPLPNWQPSRLPTASTLQGRLIRLEKLTSLHGPGLYQTLCTGPLADPKLWDFLIAGPFSSEDGFRTHIRTLQSSSDPLYYTVVDQTTNAPLGYLSLMSIVPEHGRIEIGNVTFGGAMQRTALGTEAIYLLAKECFQELGYRRVEWKCDATNKRSMRAAERFGFKAEGVHRQHMVFKGKDRDTAWFSVIDGEWDVVKRALEVWFGKDNFDGEGRQIKTLEQMREALEPEKM